MERVEIATSSEVPEGGARRFRVCRGGAAVEAFLVRFQGGLYAYVNRCTHRHVELDLGKGAFFHPDGAQLLCRAHGALFDVRTGACTGGPCAKGTALEAIPVEERDGRILAVVE